MNLFNIILSDKRLNFSAKCFMLLILEDCHVDSIQYYVNYFGVCEKTVYNALNMLFKCNYLLKGKYFVIHSYYISSLKCGL